MLHVIILAGGGGTRLWPMSRNSSPKQLQSFLGRETLLQKTYRRVLRLASPRNIFIATNARHAPSIRKQVPSLRATQLSLEPAKRDTAAAFGLAVLRVARRDPRAAVAMAYADHVILNEPAYLRALRAAEQLVIREPSHSILLGIEPTYPETGYGYIKMGARVVRVKGLNVYRGLKFIEKPPLQKAKVFVKKWQYVWNPGMFVWRADTLLQLYRQHLPIHYRHLMAISKALGTRNERSVIAKEFPKMPAVSIDYGIMEKIHRMLVVPVSIGWADIGHWRTVHEMLDSDPIGNTVRGKHVGIATKNSLIMNLTDRLVATAGVENLIVVQTDDATLVCHREHAQEVKKIVEDIKKKKWLKYL